MIGTFGHWEGTETSVEFSVPSHSFKMDTGDALVLPCTIDGAQGPAHSVSPVLEGTRWALILGTTL